MQRLLFICIVLLLAVTAAYAQEPRHHRRIPYLLTLNPQRLASRLTRNLETDSEKVTAIHSWITYNIRYDVKKWQRFDYTRLPVKKILRRRKATCTGYSDLFDTLCTYAQLKCVTVPGYTKNANVDIVDTFYVEDHEWNAVEVDGAWKLVDATWDAGYIKYGKRTLLGYVVYATTLGRFDLIRYKPRFIRDPSLAYCLRTGSPFTVDHLPLDPLWQLRDTVMSIEQFARDSAYYFKRYGKFESEAMNDGRNGDRLDHFSSDADEREMQDGINGYKFNPRNYFCIGNTYFIKVKLKLKDIDRQSTDTLGQLAICDSILAHIDTALMYYNNNAYMLAKQHRELIATNNLKKSVFNSNHVILKGSTRQVIRSLSQSRSRSLIAHKTCHKLESSNAKKLDQLKNSKGFRRIKPARESHPKDSLLIVSMIKLFDDSIRMHHEQLVAGYNRIDSMFAAAYKKDSAYSERSYLCRRFIPVIIHTRLEYFDELDHEIKQLTDTLIPFKMHNDSSLYENGEYHLQPLFNSIKHLKPGVNQQYRYYKQKLQLLKKLKSICVQQDSIEAMYDSTLAHLEKEYDECDDRLDSWEHKLINKYLYCFFQRFFTQGELRKYLREKHISDNMSGVRKSYINRHFSALQRVNNAQRRELLTRQKSILRYKKKLTRTLV